MTAMVCASNRHSEAITHGWKAPIIGHHGADRAATQKRCKSDAAAAQTKGHLPPL